MSATLYQEHPDCDGCSLAVVSQPGCNVDIVERKTGRTVLALRVISSDGCWLGDALRRAFDHAREAA